MQQPSIDQMRNSMLAPWIAGDFGAIARTIGLREAESFVARMGLEPDARVLDIACGTGNVTIPLARRGVVATGLDMTPRQGVAFAIGRKIVVDPEPLQVPQESSLFWCIEAAECELNSAGILRQECGGIGSAPLQLPRNGHDTGFDSIEAKLQPVANRRFFSPE
jgi:SAM-dependent methyltransferase